MAVGKRGSQPGLEVQPLSAPEYGKQPTYPEAVAYPYTLQDAAAKGYAGPLPPWVGQPAAKKPRTVCGMRVTTFVLAVALVVVIILAAAIGGGVGSAVNQKNQLHNAASTSTPTPPLPPSSSSSSAAATPTPTSPSPSSSTPAPVYGLSDCPHSNGTTYQDQALGMSTSYVKLCSSYFTTAAQNLADAPTATFNDCLLLCDSLRKWGNANLYMNAIVYNPTGAANQPVGNCWCLNIANVGTKSGGTFDIAVLAGGGGGGAGR